METMISKVTWPPPINLLFGYGLSVLVGGFVIHYAMQYFRNRSREIEKQVKEKPDIYLLWWLGGFERFSYTTSILLNQPAWIAAWLAIKVLTRWNKNEKERWANISEGNIYLIGNMLTVMFGIAGGLLSLLLPK